MCPLCDQPTTIVGESNPATGRIMYDKIAWHTVRVRARAGRGARGVAKLLGNATVTCPASELPLRFD